MKEQQKNYIEKKINNALKTESNNKSHQYIATHNTSM